MSPIFSVNYTKNILIRGINRTLVRALNIIALDKYNYIIDKSPEYIRDI